MKGERGRRVSLWVESMLEKRPFPEEISVLRDEFVSCDKRL